MGKDDSTLTNITLQTFASDGDVALVDQRWEKDGPAFLRRLFAAGLLSYEKGQIWNKDSKLMRFVIFKYGSPEALKRCLPIWKEVEKQMFENVVVKVTAYRGVISRVLSLTKTISEFLHLFPSFEKQLICLRFFILF